MLRFLWHLTGNASDAEDLLQETMLTVWRKREQFEGRGSPSAYLKKVAFRLFLNSAQKHQRRARLAPHPEERFTPPESREVEESDSLSFLLLRVREAVHALPEGSREAFILMRFENLTCAEISAMTGVPLKTVESRIARATQILAHKLKAYRHHLPAREA